MKNPRTLRLVLTHGLLGSALFASPIFALTPAEFDSLRAKADRGNAIAQYNLGLAHADRREAIYDPAQAYAWLSLAAANGTNGKALSNLTGLLTPEQLAEGQRRLAILSASPVSPAADVPSPVVSAEPSPVAPPAVVSPDLDQEQKKLSAELAAAWKENELLKAGLNAQLADAKKRIAIAEAALASKDKEISALQTRLAETPAPVPPAAAAPIGVSAELASLRSERDQLQSAATAASAELAQLRAASAKANTEQASLREKLTRAATSVTEAQRAQALAEAEAASLKAAADRASAERLAVAAQLETVTAELAAAKEAAAKSPTPANPAEPDPRIAETIKTFEEKLAAQGEALQTIWSKKHQEISKELYTAHKQLQEKQTEINSLKVKVSLLTEAPTKSEPHTLIADRDRLAATVKTLTEERDALTTQLAAAKAALPAAPAPEVVVAPIPAVPTPPAAPDTGAADRIAELEKAKADTDAKLAAALRSFTLQQAEIDRLQKSLASIDEERAATADKLTAATAELATLRPQAATVTAVSADAETLRAQLGTANRTIGEQTSALSTANQNLADARKTIDAATTELVSTRDQLRQTQAQSAAFAVENQQLKTRLALAGSLPAGPAPSRPGSLPVVSLNLPAATPPPPAPAIVETPAAPRVHTVAPGDSLSKISKQYYGTAARWNDILQANKDVIRNPDSLTLGTKLRIP